MPAEEWPRSEPSGRAENRSPSRIRRVFHWVKRGLQVSIIVLLTFAIAGAIYQAVADEIDQRKYAAPGEIVSVGGHTLHINCAGEGSPTVILESGSGGTSIEWSAWVQPEVAEAARVCAYDRAGTAWSEPGPRPKDAEQITGELHALLGNAGIEGPYVLVGHSVGGHYYRVYADHYPEEVAGMVLVDSAHPEQFERLGVGSMRLLIFEAITKVRAVLGIMGVSRPTDSSAPDLPLLQREQEQTLYRTTPYVVAVAAELDALPEVLEQVRNTGSLGEKPLAVVSAEDRETGMMADSEEKAAHIERESLALQEEFTALSSDSTWRVVEGATHFSVVTAEQHAQQTSEEILKVVEAVRTGQPLAE